MPRKAGSAGGEPAEAARARPGEVYFEFQPVGQAMKVMAIDAATGTEVAIIGPLNASQSDLQEIALRKLRRRMAKDTGR